MIDEVSRCPKCRGFDGSIDIKTNKFKCNKCPYTGSNVKMEWYQYIEELENKKKKGKSE